MAPVQSPRVISSTAANLNSNGTKNERTKNLTCFSEQCQSSTCKACISWNAINNRPGLEKCIKYETGKLWKMASVSWWHWYATSNTVASWQMNQRQKADTSSQLQMWLNMYEVPLENCRVNQKIIICKDLSIQIQYFLVYKKCFFQELVTKLLSIIFC